MPVRDEDRTKEQLLNELRALRREVEELKTFEAAQTRIRDDLLKFSHAVAQSPSAIVITDTSGNIEYVNPKFTELTGYSLEEALGQNPRILKSGETTPEEYAHLWDTILSGREWRGEFHNRKKNGELFWEFASISPIRDFDGVINHFVAIKEDITERKRTEEILRASSEYTDNILGSMADALVVINPDATIKTVNRAACDLLEYSGEELLGRPIDVVTADDIPFMNTLMRVIEDGSVKDHEMLYRTKTGQDIPVSLNAAAMYARGEELRKTSGIIIIMRDMREMKRLQRQLIHSEKMACLGTLAGGVAHEIKNPLAIILQGLEYLQPLLSSDPLVLDVTERIRKAALRTDRIIMGLLNFSRQTPVQFEEADIVPVIEETIRFVDRQLALKKAGIIRRFAPDLPRVMIDAEQMRQVFVNILSNALESVSEKGTIAISLQKAGTETGRDAVRIRFTDDGAGIPEKDLLNVFDPFFSTKRKDGNAGLGLSIVKGIIEGHGGVINIESGAGWGTDVIVTLPSARRA